MDYEQTITTSASIDRCWAALADVTTYPDWTASMSAVEPLDGPTLRIGNRFRIRQPGLPTTTWRVSEVREGESFSWESHTPGVHTVAYHRLSRTPDGATRITIGIRQQGALAWLVALFTAAKTRRYLQMESAGLKAAAEATAPAGEPRPHHPATDERR
jgi:uncharacterized membrane protein